MGDLAIACFHHLKPILGNILPILIKNIDDSLVSVCNNAIWAIGEIALQTGSLKKKSAPPALSSLSLSLSLSHTELYSIFYFSS